MASIDSIVAQLRQAVDHLHQALARVRAARDMAQEGRHRAEALGARGVVARFQAIADRIDELERMLLAGVEAGERLIAQTEAIRHGGGTAGGGRTAVPVGGGTTSAPEPAALPPATDPPRWVRHWARILPVRPGGKGPTHGQLLDAKGVPVGPVRSREDPSLVADLDLNEQERNAMSMLSHAEAHTAARIRRGEAPRDAVLILNNDMCAGRYSCQSLLRGILPQGARLSVYVARPDGTLRRPRIFEGTGERIRR